MKLVSSQTHQILIDRLAALLLLVYPSLMIAVKGGMNGIFLLLLLISISALIFRPSRMPSIVWDKETVLYLAAMAALPVAIFLSQIYHHQYSAHPYDAASRFLLAVPIFMLLRRVRFKVVAMVQYGFPLGAIIGWVMAKDVGGRIGTPFLDVIHFGDFELILGVLSALSINWTGRDSIALRILKILGLLAGVYASIQSGSRGGWLAMPFLFALILYFKVGKVAVKSMLAMLLLVLTASFSAYLFNPQIHQRVDQVVNDVAAFHQGNHDTSTGVRLQLYKAAVLVFVRNPIFGVGPEGFKLEMEAMQQSGELTATAAELGRGEVHNDILSKAAGMGIWGLIAILLIYGAPLKIFIHAVRHGSVRSRQAGILGIAYVSGFVVFGLTVEILNLTMAAAFYSFTVAVLLAASLNVHHDEQRPSSINNSEVLPAS